MDADFSEFSYGYAAIREAEVGLGALYTQQGAPKLPSLVEEESLGWDVRLAFVDYALFLQFKRAQYVSRRHPDSPTWPGQNRPHYRYSIDTSGHQHKALMKLESDLATTPDSGNVYYAAPVFHSQHDFDFVYSSGSVLKNSSMILPSELGEDDGVHHHTAVAPGASIIMSEPRSAQSDTTWSDLETRVREKAQVARTRDSASRLTVGALESILVSRVRRLDRDIEIDNDAPVISRLHRSAAILGCGLALFTLDPEIASDSSMA